MSVRVGPLIDVGDEAAVVSADSSMSRPVTRLMSIRSNIWSGG